MTEENEKKPFKSNLGEWLGHSPGRPPGAKSKTTVMKERLLGALDEVNKRLQEQEPESMSWLAQRIMANDPEIDKFLMKLIPEAKELDVDQHTSNDATAGLAKLQAMPPLERLMAMRDLLDTHIQAMAPPALPEGESEDE